MDIITAGQKTKSMFLVNRQLCLPPDDPTSSRKDLKSEKTVQRRQTNVSSIVVRLNTSDTEVNGWLLILDKKWSSLFLMVYSIGQPIMK